ncbi:tRNA (uridine(34)/cytosine(34)/5-carboxymethylaminomethyluridine(34)-2'-O)-methyltransferase TrmL [Candidatus Marinamargulisbacteria bacterium SCGC AG-343-D04]|nr:tRNA (uridine(34)/cytosine(34)/5-carboxymethylaminomethyluridine(34)-2'-O)-methyltransferase TrmL [Candidatus Marinamargulisbacteria bacterium SCGC AG-343-D04]
MPKIILVEPEIPQNTGNIARLTAANQIPLVLLGKLGFSLDDKRVKRAGLDYWPYVNWHHDPDTMTYLKSCNRNNLFFLSTHSTTPYTNAAFTDESMLVLGGESKGLPPHIHEQFKERFITIPMASPHIRSLNLSNATAIVLYEILRQTKHPL